MRTGDTRMDDTHGEFMALMHTLRQTPPAERMPAYDALVRHTEAHFAQEERWMAQLGLPPQNCHAGQHANVLETLHEVGKRARQGDPGLIERMLDALDEWFALHVVAMDSALADALRAQAPAQAEAEAARSRNAVLSTLP
jgi:hemerythrin-like metal-binding protein